MPTQVILWAVHSGILMSTQFSNSILFVNGFVKKKKVRKRGEKEGGA